MAKTRSPAARPARAPKRNAAKAAPALPIALAKVAKAKHAAKLAAQRAQGLAAIANIKQRMSDISANLVDIGLALVVLKAAGMPAVFGHASFEALCNAELRMPVSRADFLIALATRLPREVVTDLGPDRADALMELADATPADDRPEELIRAKLKLPDGTVFDVAAASNKDIKDVARVFRDARPQAKGKRSAGLTSSREEKSAYGAFEKRLAPLAKGLGVKVRLVASRHAKGAKVRIEGHLSELRKLGEAIAKAAGK